MSNLVEFTISFDKLAKTLTVTDNGTGFDNGTPSTISIYIKTEDKDSYVYKFESDEVEDIAAFLNPSTGLVISPSIFVTSIPDNFYTVSVVTDETLEFQMTSELQVFAITDVAKRLVETTALSLNFPLTKVIQSLPLSMALQLLELLLILSDSAVYSYERENRWRKLYNAIISTVDEYQY